MTFKIDGQDAVRLMEFLLYRACPYDLAGLSLSPVKLPNYNRISRSKGTDEVWELRFGHLYLPDEGPSLIFNVKGDREQFEKDWVLIKMFDHEWSAEP